MASWFFIAVLSAIVFGIASYFFKINSHKNWPLLPFFIGVYSSGTLGFLINTYLEGNLNFTLPVIIWGMIVGIGSTFGNVLYMKALQFGPASLTSPIVNTNIVLIIVMSLFVFGETLGLLEIIGIILIILSLSFLPLDPNEKLTIKNRIWYAYAILATVLFFLRNGGLKITEEIFLPNTPILFVGYLLGFLWALFAHFFSKERKKIERSIKNKAYIFGLITGIFSYGGMQLYAVALQTGPASIISPIFATNSLIVAILSILFLKERLTRIQIITLLSVFVGIVLLRI